MKVSAFSELAFFFLTTLWRRAPCVSRAGTTRSRCVPINNECVRACTGLRVCANACTRTAPMYRCTCLQNFVWTSYMLRTSRMRWICMRVRIIHKYAGKRASARWRNLGFSSATKVIACLAGKLCLRYFHRDTYTHTQTFRDAQLFQSAQPRASRKWRAFVRVGGCNPRERTWIRSANLAFATR